MFYLFSPQAISNLIASNSLLSKKMLHLDVLVHIVHFSFWYISRRYICKKYYLRFDLFWLEWFSEELNLAASQWQYTMVPILPQSHYKVLVVWLFMTPWTVSCQAPLSMEFSRQEFWSGLPFPSLTQGSNLGLLHCGQILYCLSHEGSCTVPLVLDIVQNGKLSESNYWWIRLPLCLLSSLLSFFFCEWPVYVFCTFLYLVLIFFLLIFQDLKKKMIPYKEIL